MGLFHYKGRNQESEIVTGEFEAGTSSDTPSHLINIVITPINIEAVVENQIDDAMVFLSNLRIEKKPDLNDPIMFSRIE